MQIKKHFLAYIEQAEKVIDQNSLSRQELATIKTNLDTVELIIPVVGGFSAGKSTLINSFLGQDLLLTKVTPETALATELRYSTEDYLEAITVNDQSERYPLTELVNLRDNAQRYKFLRLFLNHEALKEIQPLVLVDMPGFDAPIKNHNQAILNYLNKGTYFIFLTSIEDGTLSRSMVREIENIQLFAKEFAFGLSKTNLRPPSDIEAVKAQIETQLKDYFYFQQEVVLFDQNGGENLRKILIAIDPEALLQSLFEQPLKDNYSQAVEEIKIKISTLQSSQKESDSAIKSLQESLKLLTQKKSQAITDIESKYSQQSVEKIIHKISRELLFNKDSLVSLAISSPNAFSREINDIIKNSLLSEVQTSFQNISGQIITDFSTDLRHSLGDLGGFNFGHEFVDRLQDKVRDFLYNSQSTTNPKSVLQQTHDDNGKLAGLYRVGATIFGLTTSIVSPLIEVVMIFLPDIINFFTKDSREQKMRMEVENKLINEIIPQIKSKIRGELLLVLNGQIKNLINDINQQFASQIEQKTKEIQQAAEEREKKSQQLSAEIERLNANKDKLTQLAQQYLSN